MNAKLYKTEKENYVLVDTTKGTYDDGYMLGTSRESQYNKLSIKNCESIELGYDLDELAKKFRDETIMNSSFISDETSFKEGAKAIIEILGDKKFSEEDIRNAMDRVWDWSEDDKDKDCSSMTELRNKHIQSLQQTEWDVEIVTKKVIDETKIVGSVKGVKGSGSKITTYKSVPKLDTDGCLILKRI